MSINEIIKAEKQQRQQLAWKIIGKSITFDNGTTIYYAADGTDYIIESRKRKIPHANGSGFWWFTSYFVLKNGVELAEKNTLSSAKEYVEKDAVGLCASVKNTAMTNKTKPGKNKEEMY